MHCLICRSLELAFESQRSHYLEASAQACNKITPRLAAYWNVEMERARSDMDEHRAVCVFYASSTLTPAFPHHQFAPKTAQVIDAVVSAA